MRIEWTITKERGNHRPVLEYTLTLSDFERRLYMPAVRIESAIPKPPDAGLHYCWPGHNERGEWTPAEHYRLMSPKYSDGFVAARLRLPWRDSNEYPEVEASFETLRKVFEEAMAHAAASAPLQLRGHLETSMPTKQAIAPAVAASRMLRAVKG